MNQLFLDTLEEQYDRNKFKRFILEFFNKIDLAEKSITVESQFSKHIDSLFFLGQYEDQFKKKVHLLEVRLKTESKLEQARTMQRNLIAKYLKDHWIDGALVAFYTSNSTSWRLSLVKVDYKFDDKGKTKEELSPAKRYSFLVGKDEPTHTAQNQLLKIFEQTTQNPALGQIEEAFSVEKVTKEFFEEYRKLFEGLVAELKKNHTFINEATKNNINTDNFAKKLLGQIVFLYFLQKKGWLGVLKGKSWGEGDKNFLRNIFDKSLKDKKNFFNNYLEKLFYDTLNNPRSDRVDRNYSEYFQSKIPFLNGGLFEPQYDWENSLMYLDNRIFEQIFDVFDRYNFTVREDEPLEKEVAVDPEMLGKVFENLIEENLRKGKGTYYTPREIVHYMCRESLINYLVTETKSTDKDIRDLMDKSFLDQNQILKVFEVDWLKSIDSALENIKIVDPACGSGAFLVGMLQEIVRLRFFIQWYFIKDRAEIKSEYPLKKDTIQNSIYGVDIDPGAIEIAKLRLWLSLVVDYDLEEIEPLPNLDYKLMVGNSLIEKLDAQASAITNDSERNKLIDKLRELKDVFFNLSGSQEKKELRKQINELILLIENYDNEKKRQNILDNILDRNRQVKLFDIGIEQQTLADIPTQIKQLDILKDIKETDHFEWHLNFNEVFENGGFDIVIANPPYLRVQELSINDKDKYRNLYRSAIGSYDLYVLFFERGFGLLNEQGILNYITPDKWVNGNLGKGLRKLVASYINKLISFKHHQIFNASTYSSLVWIKKTIQQRTLYCELDQDLPNNKDLQNWLVNIDNAKFSIIPNNTLGENAWVFTNNEAIGIMQKLAQLPRKASNVFENIFQGIATSKDSVYFISRCSEEGRYIVGYSEALGKKVLLEKDFVKPLLMGDSVHRYEKLKTDSVVIFPYSIINLANSEKANSMQPSYIEKHFPKAWQYFLSCENLIKGRENGKLRNAKDWYRYIYPKNLVLFNKPKLVCPYISVRSQFSLDEKGEFYTNTKVYGFIKKKEIQDSYKYLLALLNSTLTWFYVKNVSAVFRGGYYTYSPMYLNNFPLPSLSPEQQKSFIEIVDEILALTNSSDYLSNAEKQVKVKDYEKQIDQLVYRLYDLTPEEIIVVEGK